MGARAHAANTNDGFPLELGGLLAPYGRDRRLALRVERMPSRSRLSRGRNNGDGSWSLSRDELEGLFYFPPRGSSEAPTLSIRVIGLDSDNGVTLSVVDAVPGESSDDDEDTPSPAYREAELKKLQAELAKAKAALRATQSDLTEARKTFESELEERIADTRAEAAAEGAADLERLRAKWQAEAKERLTKQEARAEERLARARESWRRETQDEIAKAEEAWKTRDSARVLAAEAEWSERSARALADEKAAHAKTQAALAAARKAAASNTDDPKVRALREEIQRLQNTLTEVETKTADAERAASVALAEAVREKDQAARERKEFTVKLRQIETKLSEAAGERSDSAETKRLRAELAAADAKLSERNRKLAEAQIDAADARKQSDKLQSALKNAEDEWKAAETSRLSASKAEWEATSQREMERATAAMTEKLRKTELALQEARAQTRQAGDKRNAGDSRHLAEEIKSLKTTLDRRELKLAEAVAEAKRLRGSTDREASAALVEARKEWEATEAVRFAEAKAEWERHSSRVFKKAQIRLEAAEAALAEARADANATRDRRDSAEFKRLRAEFAAANAKLADCEAQLAEAQLAAGRGRERIREEVEAAVAKAEEAWKANETLRLSEIETRERERGARAFTEAMARLERTEAALTEARNELEAERERTAVLLAKANARAERMETALTEASERIETMRDPANESELHRLHNELANLQIGYAEREAEVAIAQAAARKARERSAEQMKAAMLRAEDEWRRDEAKRLEAAKMDWERQAQWAAEMAVAPEAVSATATVQRANRLLLDGALAIGLAALVMLGVTFYLRTPAQGLSDASAALPPKSVQQKVVATAQNPATPMVVAATVARVRTAPTASAIVVTTLRQGVQVSLLERHGNWARVHVGSEHGNAGLDGWVIGASLRNSSRH